MPKLTVVMCGGLFANLIFGEKQNSTARRLNNLQEIHRYSWNYSQKSDCVHRPVERDDDRSGGGGGVDYVKKNGNFNMIEYLHHHPARTADAE